MILSTDSTYLIGKTHKVCQDYAYSELVVMLSDNISPCLIISDGCSSSPNSDIGSRILVQCAKVTYYKMYEKLKYDVTSYELFGYNVIAVAQSIVNGLHLNNNCLDATLIITFICDNQLVTFMYGDGCILVNHVWIGPRYVEVKFESGAPYYLSYWTNQDRRNEYKQTFNNKLIITNGDKEHIAPREFEYDSHLLWNTPIKDCESFAISSDGLSTFFNPIGESISLLQMANEVSAFKTMTGEFLKRRISKIVTENAIKKVYNYDDISLAAVVFK